MELRGGMLDISGHTIPDRIVRSVQNNLHVQPG